MYPYLAATFGVTLLPDYIENFAVNYCDLLYPGKFAVYYLDGVLGKGNDVVLSIQFAAEFSM